MLYYSNVIDFYNSPSVLKWETIKHLVTPFGKTVWESLAALPDYDTNTLPTTKQLLRGLLKSTQLAWELERILGNDELEISRTVTNFAYELSINDNSYFYKNRQERDNDFKIMSLLKK